MCAADFAGLAPELEPSTAVVLDNLATHRNKKAETALKEHGCWFLYLTPYSPDLNPIEQAFSKLKAHLRRIGPRTSSMQSVKFASCSTPKSVGTTFRLQGMLQRELESIWFRACRA